MRDLASQARMLVLASHPDMDEEADESAKIIGFGRGPGYTGNVCAIILSKGGVKLGFNHGADLPDPDGLLEGTGKVHRYVKLDDVADLKRPALKKLLKAAHEAWDNQNDS